MASNTRTYGVLRTCVGKGEPRSGQRWNSTVILGAAAAALAAAGIVNYALARRAERDNPPDGKFVTIGGVRLHYVEGGTGPCVVLLHGNGTMARDFVLSGVFDLLCKEHRVIAFDRPGFGFSDRPRNRVWTADTQAALLQKALEQLDVQRAVVVGHSWGTLVAVAMAVRDKARIAGLVLLSGYYFPSARMDVALMSWPAIPVLGDILRYTIAPLLGRLTAPAAHRKMFGPSPVPDRFAQEFPVELEMRPSQIRAGAAEAALMIPGAAALAGRHCELSLPVAIMAGRDDKIVDCDSQAGRLQAELPGSELVTVPGAGHMIHYNVPERVAAVIGEIAQQGLPALGQSLTRPRNRPEVPGRALPRRASFPFGGR